MTSNETCSEIVQQNYFIKIGQLTQVGVFPVFGLVKESIEVIPDELWIHCETISPQRVIQFFTKIKPLKNKTAMRLIKEALSI